MDLLDNYLNQNIYFEILDDLLFVKHYKLCSYLS